MSSKCKSHNHPPSSFPKMPKNIFYFTLFHLSTSIISTYYVSLYYSFTKPQDYPEYYFEFHLACYSFLWGPCMANLILSRIRGPGRARSTDRKEDEECEHCKIRRVDRSHHCSTCKQCVIRMDHHCIWVSNCIGLSNHKNFYWYTFFTATGGTYHMFLVFAYTFSDYPPAYPGVLIKLIYFYHSFIVLIFSYFCYTLLNIQTRLILSGNTNMEYMKEMGTNLSFLRCVIYPIESDYDIGFISNLFQVFGTDVLFWFFPTAADNLQYSEGSPLKPRPSRSEIQELKEKYDLD